MEMKAVWTLDAKGLNCPMPMRKQSNFSIKYNWERSFDVFGADPGSKMIFQDGGQGPDMSFLR
ncbi:MAG: hypothetical protein KKC76_12690 [Proteobacteria bacterium]|nr:hypothetical protein [Pseudomonadota bacterium]MBU4295030.1 hypothetical protein [Pseudomonadota bacterium]MCG2746618.1 hypothetical protein [Desulfobulbaceae bacterium]